MGFEFTEVARNIGNVLDGIGVSIIIIGFLISTIWVLIKQFDDIKEREITLYRFYRRALARSILLGLEFLVAGDIIRTIAGDLDLRGVLILGVIVVIRSILSFEFQVEIDGRLPWKRGKQPS